MLHGTTFEMPMNHHSQQRKWIVTIVAPSAASSLTHNKFILEISV
jgi:hypothetical protein